MTFRACIVVAVIVGLNGCVRQPSSPVMWASDRAHVRPRGVNRFGPIAAKYPTYAGISYTVPNGQMAPDKVVHHFEQSILLARRDYGKAFRQRKIVWNTDRCNRNGQPDFVDDFDQVQGVVFFLLPPPDDPGYRSEDSLEWLMVLPVDEVFDEAIPPSTLTVDKNIYRDAWHRKHDEKTGRYIETIDPLEQANSSE